MLELFAIPELSGNNPFIRGRSIMVLNSYKNFKFANFENIKIISDQLFKALSDNDLSIKVNACICAPSFFSHDQIKPMLDQHISTILTIYITIINEIELEELLESLENIIGIFNIKCKDFAVELTKILVQRFIVLNQQEDDNQLKTNKNFLVVEGIVKTIICIYGIFSPYKEIFPDIFESSKQIIDFGFEEENFEKLESSIEMIIAVCKNENVPFYPQLWAFYNKIIESVVGSKKENDDLAENYPDKVFIGGGYECLQDIVNAILYYIVR
jgi:hypothetical protein